MHNTVRRGETDPVATNGANLEVRSMGVPPSSENLLTRSDRHPRSSILLAVVVVSLLAVPAALLIWFRLGVEDRLSEIIPQPEPLLMEVEEAAYTGDQSVEVTLVWGQPPRLYAPAWSGVITEIIALPPVTLANGDPIVAIDNVPRLAAATAKPFWRDLSLGDQGADVAMLQTFLGDLGFYDGKIDGLFGQGVRAAVVGFADGLGIPASDGTFLQGWVIWLPAPEFRLESGDIAAGQTAPPQGSPIATGRLPLNSADLVLLDAPERSTFDDDWGLTVDGLTIQLDVNGSVPPEHLEDLADVVDPGLEGVSARVHLLEPVIVKVMPASAVTPGDAGTLCVWVLEDGEYQGFPVEVAGGGGGSVELIEGPQQGDAVLVNPVAILEDTECRSH